MKYVIAWTSNDPVESVKRFQKFHDEKKKMTASAGGHPDIVPGVKLLDSLHVVGQPSGYIILEVSDPAGLQALVVKWGDVLTLEVYPVIDDDAAIKAFEHAA